MVLPKSLTRPTSKHSAFKISTYFFVTLLCATAVLVVQNRLVLNTTSSQQPSTHNQNTLRESFVEHSATANTGQYYGVPDNPAQLAGLDCERFGGPPDASEMVYWKDIPSDAAHLSPLHRHHPSQRNNIDTDDNYYLTFEPDRGGFNNIRMALESVIALAFAMGRTLVLPPEQEFYLLRNKKGGQQRSHFSFGHFFHMQAIHNEHAGLDIITMDDFLTRQQFINHQTGRRIYPPGNRTNWNGASQAEIATLYKWLRETSHLVEWSPEHCLAAFPADMNDESVEELIQLERKLQHDTPEWQDFVGKPVGVNASAEERLRENWAERKKLCIYNTGMQLARNVHFPCERQSRLLVHFYAFLFFQDWRHDLWLKRFMRDHVRYVDEIQCAAARIVARLRQRATVFDSMHVRRGDFQYKKTRIEATVLLQRVQKKIPKGTLVYIGTDEQKKSYFDPLKEHYELAFLDDFQDELKGINSNYYGMIDQLITSRGRTFFGCWFSTFTGYILRLRGYHADKEKAPGYEQGITNSWFYAVEDRFDHMQTYYPVKKVFYAREFPTSWRLLDTGV